jgi:hypothetical protein
VKAINQHSCGGEQMDVELERPTLSRGRLLLLALGATTFGAALALLGGPAAHAADDDPGLLGGLTDVVVNDIVAEVEAPVLDVVETTVNGTLTGTTGTVSAVVEAVVPIAAPVTAPVVTGVTDTITGTVSAVADARPVTGVTSGVVDTTTGVVDSLPIVGDVVDSLPAIPEGAPDPGQDGAPLPTPATATPIDLSAHGEQLERAAAFAVEHATSHIRTGTTEAAVTSTQSTDLATDVGEAAPDGTPAPQHPSTPSTAPANGSASGAGSTFTQHPADATTFFVATPDIGVATHASDEAVPASPTFGFDSSPD